MKSLTDKFFRYVAGTSGEPMAIEVSHAQGMHIHTASGKRFLDMIAGISVCNAGHSHPTIVEAVKNQVEKYMHLMVYGELVEAPQVELAELLCSQLPDSLSSVYFVNSGAEAVEGALKLAKRATGRGEIIHCENSYHGCTNGAMSVMGCDSHKAAFQPLLPNTKAIRFGNHDDLQEITAQTACFIVEPVQGEAGIRIADNDYWRAVRQRCDETGTLLVFDEIQTGMGRTGQMFCFQHYDIKPDILLLAKALGGGMPLGAFIASKELMSLLTYNPVLGHMTTFGGHPVSCAAGLAHLKLLIQHNYPALAEEKGRKLEEIMKNYPGVKEVRRKGLMMAVDFKDENTNLAMYKQWLDRGVFTDWFLFCNTALRIAPPLIIENEDIEEFKKLIL
ncbi:aspartate aminotransferase family protein [Bacteroidales bacterium OttesenSCG-928-C03]|nr:aspartate aminotransferase family protein [Bacteroidales bacterium OttesenSCG-928-C03]MDL2326613.1 aspartate aminotransferase family protein [Bacteroidales bacterium OttesenSCG-928-A14]